MSTVWHTYPGPTFSVWPLLTCTDRAELHFSGNCLKGSRPILSFDSAFDTAPHLRILKELFHHAFGVPQGARKSKPFIDRVLAFSLVDGRVWVRHYQIAEEETEEDKDMSLVEIGPRMLTLNHPSLPVLSTR